MKGKTKKRAKEKPPRQLKQGIRVLGIDDSPFSSKKSPVSKSKSDKVLIVGVVYRDGIIEGILSTNVQRDGDDSTAKIIRMVKSSRFLPQIRVVMMNGVMVGGFNVVDIKQVSRKLGAPVIAVTRKKPRMKLVIAAINKLTGAKTGQKLKNLERAGKSLPLNFSGGSLYGQLSGISKKEADLIIKRIGIEPVRIAHLIGSGIVKGESSGRL